MSLKRRGAWVCLCVCVSRSPGYFWSDLYAPINYPLGDFVAPATIWSIGWLGINFAIFGALAWYASPFTVTVVVRGGGGRRADGHLRACQYACRRRSSMESVS